MIKRVTSKNVFHGIYRQILMSTYCVQRTSGSMSSIDWSNDSVNAEAILNSSFMIETSNDDKWCQDLVHPKEESK